MPRTAASSGLYDVEVANPVFMGTHCESCEATFFPPLEIGCEVCGSESLRPCDLPAEGTLYSVATVHLHGNPKVETPFTVAEIQLDAGPLIRALLAKPVDTVEIGQRVEGQWVVVRQDDDGSDVVEPRFALAHREDS